MNEGKLMDKQIIKLSDVRRFTAASFDGQRIIADRSRSRNMEHYQVTGELKDYLREKTLVLDWELSYER